MAERKSSRTKDHAELPPPIRDSSSEESDDPADPTYRLGETKLVPPMGYGRAPATKPVTAGGTLSQRRRCTFTRGAKPCHNPPVLSSICNGLSGLTHGFCAEHAEGRANYLDMPSIDTITCLSAQCHNTLINSTGFSHYAQTHLPLISTRIRKCQEELLQQAKTMLQVGNLRGDLRGGAREDVKAARAGGVDDTECHAGDETVLAGLDRGEYRDTTGLEEKPTPLLNSTFLPAEKRNIYSLPNLDLTKIGDATFNVTSRADQTSLLELNEGDYRKIGLAQALAESMPPFTGPSLVPLQTSSVDDDSIQTHESGEVTFLLEINDEDKEKIKAYSLLKPIQAPVGTQAAPTLCVLHSTMKYVPYEEFNNGGWVAAVVGETAPALLKEDSGLQQGVYLPGSGTARFSDKLIIGADMEFVSILAMAYEEGKEECGCLGSKDEPRVGAMQPKDATANLETDLIKFL